PVDLALVDAVDLVLDLAHPGQHAEDLRQRAHLADHLHLLQEVGQPEVLALRSGWKTSKSFNASPLEANMIGRPVTRAIDRAAPPRASPSSLVNTTPSKPTPSANAFAVFTASWPIIASTTKRISSGD